MQVREVVQSDVLLELGCGCGNTGYYLFSNMPHKWYILSDLSNRLGLVTAQQRWSDEDTAVAFMPLDFFHDSFPSVDVVLLDSILSLKQLIVFKIFPFVIHSQDSKALEYIKQKVFTTSCLPIYLQRVNRV